MQSNDDTPPVRTIEHITKGITIHQIQKEDSPCFFVLSNSLKKTGYPARMILTHNTDDGRSFPIIIENSWIPIDLATFAPKEELLKNHALRGTINNGYFSLVLAREAEQLLQTPEARQEMTRLEALKMAMIDEATGDMAMSPPSGPVNFNKPDLPAPTKGTMELASGVPAPIVEVMEREMSDSDKLGMLRNLMPLFVTNEKAKQFIRSKTSDGSILAFIGQ